MTEETLSDEYIDNAIAVDDRKRWCGAPEHMAALRELRARRDAQKDLRTSLSEALKLARVRLDPDDRSDDALLQAEYPTLWRYLMRMSGAES